MNPSNQALTGDRARALTNGMKRPLKTSKLNPYAMRKTAYGEVRISPKISALKAQGMSQRKAVSAAESKANYVPQNGGPGLDRRDTRKAAAEMLKGYRKTKMFSRADARSLVEFARSR